MNAISNPVACPMLRLTFYTYPLVLSEYCNMYVYHLFHKHVKMRTQWLSNPMGILFTQQNYTMSVKNARGGGVF